MYTTWEYLVNLSNEPQNSTWNCICKVRDVLEFSGGGDLEGEDKKGFGGICKESRFPSNISMTLLIVGRFEGLVHMHRKFTIIIFLTLILSSSS